MSSDLERMTKAELVARFDGLDPEVLALGRCVAALEPLAHRRYDYATRQHVVDVDAVCRVLAQVETRFAIETDGDA